MKTILLLHAFFLMLVHSKALITGLLITGKAALAKGPILATGLGGYLDKAKHRIPAMYESYESMCAFEGLDGPTVVNAISKNPALLNQMPPHVQAHIAQGNFGAAANAMKGVGADPMGTTLVGGALNAKKNVAATFKVVVSAPFVTADSSTTKSPDAGQYNIPLFGTQASQSNYSLPGILSCSVAGYVGQAISGATLASVGGTLPAPFAAVAVDPTAWYIIYIKGAGTSSLQAAMWVITSNPKYPYAAFLGSMYGTVFHIGRSRYILGSAAEQDQYGFAMEKAYLTTFGKTQSDTIDPDIFISPEQLQTGRADIDLDLSITSRDYLIVPSDPVNVSHGFRFGFFVSNFRHQSRTQG